MAELPGPWVSHFSVIDRIDLDRLTCHTIEPQPEGSLYHRISMNREPCHSRPLTVLISLRASILDAARDARNP